MSSLVKKIDDRDFQSLESGGELEAFATIKFEEQFVRLVDSKGRPIYAFRSIDKYEEFKKDIIDLISKFKIRTILIEEKNKEKTDLQTAIQDIRQDLETVQDLSDQQATEIITLEQNKELFAWTEQALDKANQANQELETQINNQVNFTNTLKNKSTELTKQLAQQNQKIQKLTQQLTQTNAAQVKIVTQNIATTPPPPLESHTQLQ